MTSTERHAALNVVVDMMICKPSTFRGKHVEYRTVCRAMRRPTRIAGLTLPFPTYAHLVIPRKNGDPSDVFNALWRHPDARTQTRSDIAKLAPVLAYSWEDRVALVSSTSSFMSLYDYVAARPHVLYPLRKEIHLHTQGNQKAGALVRALLAVWTWCLVSSRSSLPTLGSNDTLHFEAATDGLRRLFSKVNGELEILNDRGIAQVIFGGGFVVIDHSLSARDTICLLHDGDLLAYHLLASRKTAEISLDEVYDKFRDAALILVLEDRMDLHRASLEDIEARVAPLAVFDNDDWPEILRNEGSNVMAHAVSIMEKYGHLEDALEYDCAIFTPLTV